MSFTIDRRRLLAALGFGPAAALPAVLPAAAAPAAREPLRLLFTRVNGEAYYGARAALPLLAVGDVVTLVREPTNMYDRRAIEVFAAGQKLGYVARIDNSALARMMDAGESFVARVARIEAPMDIRLTIDWLR